MSALNPQTPGVYTVEKSAFPPSIGEVPTAIPAFIGYSEKAVRNGKSLTNIPVLINSQADYETYFGGAPQYQFPVINVPEKTPGVPPANGTYDFKIGANYYKVGAATQQMFYMYNSIRLFYLNGGGQAWIVSVGNYLEFSTTDNKDMPVKADKDTLLNGLSILEYIPYPKPTMILIPDGLTLANADLNVAIQQQMLAQCGKLMDRVSLLDIYGGDQDLSSGVIEGFRNAIGISNMSYGISYYPFLETEVVASNEITYANVDQSSAGGGTSLDTIFPGNPSIAVLKGVTADYDVLEQNVPVPPTIAGSTLVYPTWNAAFNGAVVSGATADQEMLKWQGQTLVSMYQTLYDLGTTGTSTQSNKATLKIATPDLIKAIGNYVNVNGSLASAMITLELYDTKFPGGALGGITKTNLTAWGLAENTTSPGPYFDSQGNAITSAGQAFNIASSYYKQVFGLLNSAINGTISSADTLLSQNNSSLENSNSDYNNLMTAIANKANVLPPSGAMAGIITNTDNTIGVWNAPANVNINSVVSPTVNINDDQQAGLNVDVLAGKSINAIRSFYGRGPAIVWGARTMDGNSNDWRYINVRRTLIMIEQSVKNAAEGLVFDPNDDTTWNTCEGMIENFLNGLWKNGALQGASAADAFSVQVGLNKTMTSEDILAGIMRVSVKVAVVHPAEFIIITYEQQMAKS